MSIFWKAIGENYAIKVELDDSPGNPRTEWDNLATMVCWHRSYSLGDKHQYSEPIDFIRSLADDFRDTPEGKRVLRNAKLKYFKGFKVAKDSGSWQVMDGDGDPYWSYRWWNTKAEAVKFLREYKEEWLERAIDDELEFSDLYAIIEPHVVMLQLYLYDHSGISISSSSFVGRAHHADWDSGPVGFIYCTKERFLKETGYTASTLFGQAKKRQFKIGDMVIVKGLEDKHFARVEHVEKGYQGTQLVSVDWSYLFYGEAKKKHEQSGVFHSNEIQLVSNYAETMLENEVKTYDQYLTGDVYGFSLYEVDRKALNRHLKREKITVDEMDWDDLEGFLTDKESCWGFYGDDHVKNGMADHLEEARPLLNDLEQGQIHYRQVARYA